MHDPMYEKKAALEAVGKGGDGSINNRKTVNYLEKVLGLYLLLLSKINSID